MFFWVFFPLSPILEIRYVIIQACTAGAAVSMSCAWLPANRESWPHTPRAASCPTRSCHGSDSETPGRHFCAGQGDSPSPHKWLERQQQPEVRGSVWTPTAGVYGLQGWIPPTGWGQKMASLLQSGGEDRVRMACLYRTHVLLTYSEVVFEMNVNQMHG